MSNVQDKRLLSLIERIERLDAERAAIAADIAEVKKEAKGHGYDVKIVNLLLKRRKMDRDELAEQEALLETYEAAIGQLSRTPLAEASKPAAKAAPKVDAISPTNLPPNDVTPYDPGTGELMVPVGEEGVWPEEGDGNASPSLNRDPSVNSAIDFLKRDMNRAAAQ